MGKTQKRNLVGSCAKRLRAMGWKGARSFPSRMAWDAGDGELRAAVVRVWTRGHERAAMADFTASGFQPDPREAPDALFRDYLDLSRVERLALWSVARHAEADYLVCAEQQRLMLFDVLRETPLGRLDPPFDENAMERFLRPLGERGAPRRPAVPDTAQLSEDLARWLDLLSGKLGSSLRWSREDVGRLGRQLLLGLKALRSGSERAGDFPECLGLDVRREDKELRVRLQLPPLAQWLCLLLEAAERHAPAGAGAFSAFERQGLARQIEAMEEPPERAFEGVLRLAAWKSQAFVQLAAMLPAEKEPESWRLALQEPLLAEEAVASADFYVFEPLELDLGTCGFSRVLEAVETLARFAVEERNVLERAGGRQLDLAASDGELAEDAWRDDPFNWVCARALKLRVDPAYRETVAYLVASYMLELQGREPFSAFAPKPLTALPSLF